MTHALTTIALTLLLAASETPVAPPEPPPPAYPFEEADRLCPDRHLVQTFVPSTRELFDLVQATTSDPLYGVGTEPQHSSITNAVPVLTLSILKSGEVASAMITDGTGNARVDRLLVSWARRITFQPDSCKLYRTRYAQIPVSLAKALPWVDEAQ